VTSRTRHGTESAVFAPKSIRAELFGRLSRTEGLSWRETRAQWRRGGAEWPRSLTCQRQRAPVRETQEPLAPNYRRPAIVPREGGNHGAISGVFCAEKVPKWYMFGTHLALNI
jgi:hypothetical protein